MKVTITKTIIIPEDEVNDFVELLCGAEAKLRRLH